MRWSGFWVYVSIASTMHAVALLFDRYMFAYLYVVVLATQLAMVRFRKAHCCPGVVALDRFVKSIYTLNIKYGAETLIHFFSMRLFCVDAGGDLVFNGFFFLPSVAMTHTVYIASRLCVFCYPGHSEHIRPGYPFSLFLDVFNGDVAVNRDGAHGVLLFYGCCRCHPLGILMHIRPSCPASSLLNAYLSTPALHGRRTVMFQCCIGFCSFRGNKSAPVCRRVSVSKGGRHQVYIYIPLCPQQQ